MLKIKNERGITLSTLVVTIVVMLILASIGVYFGTEQIEKQESLKLVSELNMINNVVCERYLQYTKIKDPNFLIGTAMTREAAQTIANTINVTLISVPNSYNTEEKLYYRLTPDDLEEMSIFGAKSNYIVNYVTGEVINETKKQTSDGKILYMYSKSIFTQNQAVSF